MKTITTAELIKLLKQTNQSAFVSVVVYTSQDSKLIKLKSNPFKGLMKLAKHSGLINFVTQNSVNTQLSKIDKEPNYKVKSTWFKHADNDLNESLKCLVYNEKSGKFYLQFKKEKTILETYIFKGNRVPKEALQGFIREQPNYYAETLNVKPIDVIAIGLDSIKKIAINKDKFKII